MNECKHCGRNDHLMEECTFNYQYEIVSGQYFGGVDQPQTMARESAPAALLDKQNRIIKVLMNSLERIIQHDERLADFSDKFETVCASEAIAFAQAIAAEGSGG